MISGRSSETTYEQTENLKPGKHFFGDGRAAEHVTALEHQHFLARAREICGVHQSVVSAADDDDVVFVGTSHALLAPSSRAKVSGNAIILATWSRR